ncbi:MAG: FdhF/YdeP family oxidoreductase [Pseudomonadota bacterium]
MNKNKSIPGGMKAVQYSLKAGRKIGIKKLLDVIRSKNSCKTCAFGTGGQRGGFQNELGHHFEICKKNIQASLTDIQEAIPTTLFSEQSLAELKKLTGREIECLGRLTTPLYKQTGETHYQPISYSQAIEKIVNKMNNTSPERTFFYSSGRSSNEAVFLLQLFARLYGTNNVNNCAYFCHQASGVGLNATLGTGTATIRYQDLQESDLIFVFGANPASNHPRFIKALMQCRRRGGHVIVINPVKEAGLVKFSVPSDWKSLLGGGSEIASVYIQPVIGGDIAFIKGIAKYLLAKGLIDSSFIQQYTHNFEAFKSAIEKTTWDEICTQSGVTQTEIESVAQIYAQSSRVIFAWGMGITQHLHGVDNVKSIVNLALLRGMLGRQGAGLLPLRGHSNIQGVGSQGFVPQLKPAVFQNIEQKLDVKLPTQTGMDTMACLQAALKGKIDFAFLLGGNLYAATPDSKFAEQALNNIPLKVYLTSTMNIGHVHGIDQEVIILPVAVREEEKQATTQESMFNFVRLSDGNIIRFDNVLSEVEIISQIASKTVSKATFDFDNFNQHQEIRKAIAGIVPGFAKMDEIVHCKEEFHITNRTFYTPEFGTLDKKAHFQVIQSPNRKVVLNQFKMMTTRSEGQFNSIIYEEEDLYRNQQDRWIVLMNPEDMEKHHLQENDKVTLRNETGVMENIVVKAFDIKSGNIATYYPEANVLVPQTVDEQSKTPAFKSVNVTLITESPSIKAATLD